MNFLLIIPYYFAWHYSQGLLEYFRIWKNLLWFFWNFFSIKVLLKTFFAPFERLQEKYTGGLDVKNFFETLIVTSLMRVVGMMARALIILMGLVAVFLCLVLGVIGFLVWLFLPFLIAGLIIISIIALRR